MSETEPLLPRSSSGADLPPEEQAGRFRRRLIRVALAALILIAGVFVVVYQFVWTSSPQHDHAPAQKVLLEAHIMSKCPDARDCLQDLILPTMEKASDKVNFTLSYIGRVTDHDDGVECMHGQTECLGNIIELCAASVYPDPKLYLGFTNCLFRRYKDIPQQELIQDCALEHGMDFGKINECVSQDDGAYAMGLLRNSVTRSKEAGVTKSCTVRLNEEFWCIRDDGEWKECSNGHTPEDLVGQINQLYETTNSFM